MPDQPGVSDGCGVPLVEGRDSEHPESDEMAWFEYALPDDVPTHRAFPDAVASRLIDPDDPQVRERLVALLYGMTGHAIADRLIDAPHGDYADAILAALKEAS